MSSEQNLCLIWGSHVESIETTDDGFTIVRGSTRADGDYKISADARAIMSSFDSDARARLTYWLSKTRKLGTALPAIDTQLVDSVHFASQTAVHQRAVGLLEYIAARSDRIAEYVSIYPNDNGALAQSESTVWQEVQFLLDYLIDGRWIKMWPSGMDYGVTAAGYAYLEDQRSAPATSQAFVAMWFHESTNDLYDEGIKPAIENTGYTPLRIDRTEHINKIDDEILRELRRSRFVVADFTSGIGGVRGSVYYEAGFARGLGIPVIPTCRHDQVGDIHFDTRQYAHITWENPSDLRIPLESRIGAVIGEGPNPPPLGTR